MSLNNKLEIKGFELDIYLTMVTFMLLGDWFNKHEELDKISLAWLVSNQKGFFCSSKIRSSFESFTKICSAKNYQRIT